MYGTEQLVCHVPQTVFDIQQKHDCDSMNVWRVWHGNNVQTHVSCKNTNTHTILQLSIAQEYCYSERWGTVQANSLVKKVNHVPYVFFWNEPKSSETKPKPIVQRVFKGPLIKVKFECRKCLTSKNWPNVGRSNKTGKLYFYDCLINASQSLLTWIFEKCLAYNSKFQHQISERSNRNPMTDF